MKSLLLSALFACASYVGNATNYYFSTSGGDDSRTAAQASNPATPWKSVAKLNSIFSTLLPGDSVLFKRDEVFYGCITVSKSGTLAAPIVISAYGTGSKPEITAFMDVTTWVNLGNGVFESANAVSSRTEMNSVTINDAAVAMGRFPNANDANGGYLSYETHTGSNVITDAELTTATNWTGAEAVIRTCRFVIDRRKVNSHVGGSLTLASNLSYTPTPKFGYFLQNSPLTLDQMGEWYYNPTTKKLRVFFGNNNPSNYKVRVANLDDVVYIYDKDHIVVEGLNLTGANEAGVELYSVDNFQLLNSDVRFAGLSAINANNTGNMRVRGNNFTDANSSGLTLGFNNNGGQFTHNNFDRIALLPGMGRSGANRSMGIKLNGDRNLIQYNKLENIGYCGIYFVGSYNEIRNNFVNNFTLVKDDGGGIYTVNSDKIADYGNKIIGNIVLNGVGAAQGTSYSPARSTNGIYIDDRCTNLEIIGNTVARCAKTGLLIHNSKDIIIRDNVLYDNFMQLSLQHDVIATDVPIRNVNLSNNTMVSKRASQVVFNIQTLANDIAQMGTMDNNVFSRPLDNAYVIKTQYVDAAGKKQDQFFDLANWRSTYGKDMNSLNSDVTVQPFRLRALIGNNLFANGEFNTNIFGPSVSSNAASWTKSWVSGKLNGGTFQGSTNATGPTVYTMTGKLGALSANKVYYVSITNQSTVDTQMNIYMRKSATPFTILSNDGSKSMVRLNKTATKQEFAFVPRASEPDGILMIEHFARKNTFWHDDIKVFEADVTVTNPDDSIRLVYNHAATAATLPLDGVYADVTGQLYSNSITLPAYGTMVLIRRGNTEAVVAAPNVAPTVSITSPVQGTSAFAPANVMIQANAADQDGTVAKVDFFNGTTLLGSDSTAPYSFGWNNLAIGNYQVVAKATDNKGAVTTSESVSFTVQLSSTANLAPTVSVTSPKVNATYGSLSSVRLTAVASDVDGSVSKVEFYNGNTLIKLENAAPYDWTWTSVPAGVYNITARAYDRMGAVTTSKVVTFTVGNIEAGTTTATTTGNQLPVVSLTAPLNNAVYSAPASVKLYANASDADGSIAKVEFYAGTRLLKVENVAPYGWTWLNVPAGTYQITARAYDNKGAVKFSSVATITVKAATSSIEQGDALGMMIPDAAATTSVKVYPNPAVSQTYVSFGELVGENRGELMIRNMAGAVVLRQVVSLQAAGTQVDVSRLPAGMYIIGVYGSSKKAEVKFIKQSN